MNLRTNPVPIIPIIALIATLTVALIALAVIAAGQYAAKENIKLTFPTGWIRICTRPVEWLELSDLTFARILEEGTIESGPADERPHCSHPGVLLQLACSR